MSAETKLTQSAAHAVVATFALAALLLAALVHTTFNELRVRPLSAQELVNPSSRLLCDAGPVCFFRQQFFEFVARDVAKDVIKGNRQ